jgi:hypothetical protein
MADWLVVLAAGSPLLSALLVLFYLLAVVCAVREVMVSRTSQGSIAWLVSLALLPFPTVIIYFLVGWKHFDDYATLQVRSRRLTRGVRSQTMPLIDEADNAAWPVLTNIAQIPFLAGNEARLLIDGQATFDSIFDGIDNAQRYLLVQFYIIRDDALGQVLADKLIARAQAGVSVRLLYDDIGSYGLPRAYVDRLRAGGVKVPASMRSTLSSGSTGRRASTIATIARSWWPMAARPGWAATMSGSNISARTRASAAGATRRCMCGGRRRWPAGWFSPRTGNGRRASGCSRPCPRR